MAQAALPIPRRRDMVHIRSLALPAILTAALAIGSAAQYDRPTDTLVLSNGRRVAVHLLREKPEEYVVLVDTRQETHPKERVESLTSPILRLDELVRRILDTPAADAAANVALASWCAEQGLEHEATFFRWRAIAADWDHAPAHEALGHRRRGPGWQVRIGRSWLDKRQFERQSAEWRTSPTFETSMVQVRANLPLPRSTDAVVQWTRHYHAVYSLFGNEMGLPHSSVWAQTHLHADSRSFPTIGAREPEYNLFGEFRVVADASRPSRTGALERAWVRQILHMGYRNANSGRGTMPPWLAEAMSLFVVTCLGDGLPDPDRSLFTSRDCFRIHAELQSPDSLSRILNADLEDLTTTPGHEARLAQAYTLLDLCLHGDGGAHRPKFVAFLEGTMSGAVSSTHFQNAMGFENRTFSTPWQAWARERAAERARRLAAVEDEER